MLVLNDKLQKKDTKKKNSKRRKSDRRSYKSKNLCFQDSRFLINDFKDKLIFLVLLHQKLMLPNCWYLDFVFLLLAFFLFACPREVINYFVHFLLFDFYHSFYGGKSLKDVALKTALKDLIKYRKARYMSYWFSSLMKIFLIHCFFSYEASCRLVIICAMNHLD